MRLTAWLGHVLLDAVLLADIGCPGEAIRFGAALGHISKISGIRFGKKRDVFWRLGSMHMANGEILVARRANVPQRFGYEACVGIKKYKFSEFY